MADWDEYRSDETPTKFGGPQAAEADGADEDSEVQRKAKERELKKAEVRKRLEEAGKAGKKKKGFLTPERKKKLRKLLMLKAAENLKQQQLKSEQERQKVLSSKLPPLPDVDNINDKGQLEKIYNDLFQKMVKLEEEKYDINFVVSGKDSEINEMSIAVNDLRGKFVKPTLKKVSKYDNKFKKLADASSTKESKEDFRAKLKTVKKENVIDEMVAKTKKADKPEWSKKAKEEKEAAPKPTSKPKEEEAPADEEPEEEEAEGQEEEEEEDEEEE